MKKKRKSISYAKWGYIFILPFFICFFIFSLIPLVDTIRYSFFEYYRSGIKEIGPNFVGLQNYISLLGSDMLKYAGNELTHVLLADTWNQTKDCRYILNPPWLNSRGRADVTIHQHTAMGEGEVDFDGIFETLREMDFANKQLKPDAPKVGGDNIICVSYFGFPEKMDKQAPEALERIKRELL